MLYHLAVFICKAGEDPDSAVAVVVAVIEPCCNVYVKQNESVCARELEGKERVRIVCNEIL